MSKVEEEERQKTVEAEKPKVEPVEEVKKSEE